MAAAIVMESDTCPVHPHSAREICKSFALPWDNTRGRCMSSNTESAGVAHGTSDRAKNQLRTSLRKTDKDK